MKETERGDTCSMHGRNEKCTQNFSREIRMGRNTWYMEG